MFPHLKLFSLPACAVPVSTITFFLFFLLFLLSPVLYRPNTSRLKARCPGVYSRHNPCRSASQPLERSACVLISRFPICAYHICAWAAITCHASPDARQQSSFGPPRTITSTCTSTCTTITAATSPAAHQLDPVHSLDKFHLHPFGKPHSGLQQRRLAAVECAIAIDATAASAITAIAITPKLLAVHAQPSPVPQPVRQRQASPAGAP